MVGNRKIARTDGLFDVKSCQEIVLFCMKSLGIFVLSVGISECIFKLTLTKVPLEIAKYFCT